MEIMDEGNSWKTETDENRKKLGEENEMWQMNFDWEKTYLWTARFIEHSLFGSLCAVWTPQFWDNPLQITEVQKDISQKPL